VFGNVPRTPEQRGHAHTPSGFKQRLYAQIVDRIAPYVIAFVCSPLLVLGSLALPVRATVRTYADARAAPYGYPLEFAKSRITVAPRPQEVEARTYYPSREPFNPWENPTYVDEGRFIGSVGIVAGALALLIFISRWFWSRWSGGRSANEAVPA
jgi:hypothetical protein